MIPHETRRPYALIDYPAAGGLVVLELGALLVDQEVACINAMFASTGQTKQFVPDRTKTRPKRAV